MQQEKIWYLGPLGDLRPLTCPNPNIQFSETRYGGVHQGLSGARTMDVTGHRRAFEFEWSYMEWDEWEWLNALHTRLIPGPHYLLNPLFSNRLSTRASTLTVSPGMRNGVNIYGGSARMVRGWPDLITSPGYQHLSWSGLTSGNYMRFDEGYKTPILANEVVTGSLWAKSSSTRTFDLILDYFDRDFNQLPGVFYRHTSTTEWTGVATWGDPPTAAVAVQMAIVAKDGDGSIDIAAPMITGGAQETPSLDAREQGGGASKVLVDQLGTSSPLYPLTDCSLTLLEA